jgi:3-hydroxyisobutyrate dehydrogenase-like beta-hydroxyacid dehydrogenase
MNGAPRIGVIGAGNVGSRLARALIDRGNSVSCWNRTRAPLEPLEAAGAVAAESPAALFEASSTIFISLTDFDAVREVLDRVSAPDLQSRLVVNLTSGTPLQASELGAVVRRRGGRYLDGLLYSYPSALTKGDAVMFFAGEHDDWLEVQRTVFPQHSWDVSYTGEELGSARQMSNLFEAANSLAVEGFLLGAALADATGMPVRRYAELVVPRLMPTLEAIFEETVGRIESGDYRGEMALDLWRHGVRRQISEAEDLGVDASGLEVVARQMDSAVEAGFGSADIGALFETIRRP